MLSVFPAFQRKCQTKFLVDGPIENCLGIAAAIPVPKVRLHPLSHRNNYWSSRCMLLWSMMRILAAEDLTAVNESRLHRKIGISFEVI